MYKPVIALSLIALTTWAEAQDTSDAELATLYQQYKLEIDLEQDKADPFYSTMQILDDPEHGSNAPDRLFGFNDLRKESAKDETLAKTLLAPWLIRYVWVYPYSNYTQEAWRVLRDLPLDDGLLEMMALDLLESHPHGLARAAVLEYTEAYHPWLEAPALLDLAETLAFEDPHPDVRKNALDFVSFGSSTDAITRLATALRNNPAAEMRVVLASKIVETSGPNRAASEAPLRETLSLKQTMTGPVSPRFLEVL